VDRLSRPPSAAQPQVSAATIPLLAAACGLLAAKIYYARPLIKPIAETLGLAPQAAGLIVTMTLIGHGLGLFFVVPLADRVENRRLVLVCVARCAISLTPAAFTPSPIAFSPAPARSASARSRCRSLFLCPPILRRTLRADGSSAWWRAGS
jgi:MFS family permease